MSKNLYAACGEKWNISFIFTLVWVAKGIISFLNFGLNKESWSGSDPSKASSFKFSPLGPGTISSSYIL